MAGLQCVSGREVWAGEQSIGQDCHCIVVTACARSLAIMLCRQMRVLLLLVKSGVQVANLPGPLPRTWRMANTMPLCLPCAMFACCPANDSTLKIAAISNQPLDFAMNHCHSVRPPRRRCWERSPRQFCPKQRSPQSSPPASRLHRYRQRPFLHVGDRH